MKKAIFLMAVTIIMIGLTVRAYAGYHSGEYGNRNNNYSWRRGQEYNWSVAPKFIIFFPNSSNPGLNNFSPGVGVGVDGRYNFIKYFAVAGELDYIGLSTYNTNGVTINYSDFAIKADALGTIPLNRITPFFGLGFVYNNPSITYSGAYSNSWSGSGIGLELVGGADFIVTNHGAVTAEISLPISQNATFNGSSTSDDVGVYEIMAGYRFLF